MTLNYIGPIQSISDNVTFKLRNLIESDEKLIEHFQNTHTGMEYNIITAKGPIQNLEIFSQPNTMYFIHEMSYACNMLDIKKYERLNPSSKFFCVLDKPKFINEKSYITIQDAINHEFQIVYNHEDDELPKNDEYILVVDKKDYIVRQQQILSYIKQFYGLYEIT